MTLAMEQRGHLSCCLRDKAARPVDRTASETRSAAPGLGGGVQGRGNNAAWPEAGVVLGFQQRIVFHLGQEEWRGLSPRSRRQKVFLAEGTAPGVLKCTALSGR